MAVIVRRLKPGSDLRQELDYLARENNCNAGVLLSLVGSLSQANLRFADCETGTVIYGPLEIVSVTGTISTAGLHAHIAVADRHGRTFGGHLLEGCHVFTTCEVVMLNISAEWKFERHIDERTGEIELCESKVNLQRKDSN